MLRAIALIRTSTDRQEIESQKQQVIQMCHEDGLRDDEIVIVGQAGASAIKVDEAYQANMNRVYELLEANPSIRCVYAWAIDRIGRKESILHSFREYLVEHNIQLRIKANNLRLLDDDGKEDFGVKIQFSLYATLAAAEMQNKKERFARARDRNREQGKYNGGPNLLFGYMPDENGYWTTEPTEAPIVIEVFQEYATGKFSMTELAYEMLARGFRTKKGKKLTRSRIYAILYKYKEYSGQSEHMHYPPIISVELANKVYDVLKSSVKTRTKAYKHWYFAHRLFDCACGSKICSTGTYYKCAKKTVFSHTPLANYHEQCPIDTPNIAVSVLDSLLLQISIECHDRFLYEMRTQDSVKLRKELKVLEQKKVVLEAEINKWSDRKKKLAMKFVLDDLDEDEIDMMRQKLDDELNNKKVKLNNITEKTANIYRLLSSSDDKDLASKARFLSIMKLELEEDEKERYDLVHKYIASGHFYREPAGHRTDISDKNTLRIEIETIYDKRIFYYYPNIKSGHSKLWTVYDGVWSEHLVEPIVRK